jgi:hypothetical protein
MPAFYLGKGFEIKSSAADCDRYYIISFLKFHIQKEYFMISRADFESIRTEVTNAIRDSLIKIRKDSPEKYVLFLARAEYSEIVVDPSIDWNPYRIDDRSDLYADETRHTFLVEYLNAFYSFSYPQIHIELQLVTNLELMIYSHNWESELFLKKLYRLAQLLNGSEFPWTVDVSEMGKSTFIQEKIGKVFRASGSPMEKVLSEGYDSDLRNAFAHSAYSIDGETKNIFLHPRKSKPRKLEQISFDDWGKRFAYSVLTSYYLIDIMHEMRRSLPLDFGTNLFTVHRPRNKNTKETVPCQVEYDVSKDVFRSVKN